MNNETIDGVPLALLRNIEMTWRQASGFSNKANDIIAEGLSQLRDLLAKPAVASVTGEVAGGDVTHNTVTVCVNGPVPSVLWTLGEAVTLTHGAEGQAGTSVLMKIAADLASRKPLRQLYRICETQGRISSESLHEHLDNAGDLLGDIALDIRKALAKVQGEPPVRGVEPILVEAVAVARENVYGTYLDWLVEGGIAALEQPGTVLLIAHGTVTNDEGHGYVIPVREPATEGEKREA